ncbi:TonB-dependent receptor [Phenylobacterium sp.]|uniref:TonB-dependent receptor family protein n=1 Tax=Phenylobacterium sp. TaxID=1871053 RepID=UPI0025E72AB5|nr:TonB-dependent receptor [Phenylobacterium sp.]
MKSLLLASTAVVVLTVPSLALAAGSDDGPGGQGPPSVQARRQVLTRQIQALQGELAALDATPGAPAAAPAITSSRSDGSPLVSELVVHAEALDVDDRPVGQTVMSVTAEQFAHTPATSIGDILVLTPGVTFAMGNGPRDVSVSVRGSNARQTIGIRNIQVFEDGFPVTQPDGLARTDLTDPHAYSRIDVVQGPSSALYGNYATSGALKFYTRPGRELQGLELGLDVGSDRYRNLFVTGGGLGERSEYSGFASYVTGAGYRQHTSYRTTTVNALATYALTLSDRLTLKVINNDTDADLSIRQSLLQFRQNPYQTGCEALAQPGCASVSLLVNGVNGARQSVSAQAADLQRNDRRTIVGLRWEHDFAEGLAGRAQLDWDNRDIKQPTGATSAVGTFPSFNFIGDITREGAFAGRPAVLFAGAFYNYENINSATYNVPASGTGTPGALTAYVGGTHANYGLRARAEFEPMDRVTLAAGVGVERTELRALQTIYAYPTAATVTLARINGDRSYSNIAPDISVTFRALDALTLHARVAAGYGTPQATNLFITAAGVAGNNTRLNAQTVIGIDVGAELRLGDNLSGSVTLFDEFFRNELVSQSAGANLQAFTFNAPRSTHRGVEVAVDWRPLPSLVPGARINLSYLHNEQKYRTYVERLSAGAFSTAFDRSGNSIPGVVPNYLNARVSYARSGGPFEGLGGYIEWNIKDDTELDNANLLRAPGYSIVNLGAHYDPPEGLGAISRLSFFVTVQNIADKTYIGSASNIADSLSAVTGAQSGASVLETATGSIYSGTPRTVIAGVRAKF